MVSDDTFIMNVATDNIHTRSCNMCDRPALTFDRDNRAFCAQHATIFLVRLQPKRKSFQTDKGVVVGI